MLPNQEQQQISEAARDFAQERLKPFAAEWGHWRNGRVGLLRHAGAGRVGWL